MSEMIFIVFTIMAILVCFYFALRGSKKDRIADAEYWENQRLHRERQKMRPRPKEPPK